MRLNARELIAEARATAPTLPPAAAKLMTAMADRLDLQFVVLCESRNEAKQLAAENAALKSGASYFSYGSENCFEYHKTAEEAVEAAEAAIDDYRGDACDGWSEEVDSICWGVIMQSSTKVGERPRNEDDRCDPAIDTVCDYALLPNIETPATEAYAASLRAEGVEMAFEAAKLEVASESQCDTFDQCVTAAVKYPQSDVAGKVEMVAWLEWFAAQLRNKSEVQS